MRQLTTVWGTCIYYLLVETMHDHACTRTHAVVSTLLLLEIRDLYTWATYPCLLTAFMPSHTSMMWDRAAEQVEM